MDHEQFGEPVNIHKITTTEDLLACLRKGNTQKLEIGLGDLKVDCRLLSATEEALIIVKAQKRAKGMNPTGLQQDVFDSFEVMKEILYAATTIQGAPAFPLDFLGALNQNELSALYDQYITLNHTINPNFQKLPAEKIQEIVMDIKKKRTVAKDLFTWQLAAMGLYFLEDIIPNLPTDSDVGSV